MTKRVIIAALLIAAALLLYFWGLPKTDSERVLPAGTPESRVQPVQSPASTPSSPARSAAPIPRTGEDRTVAQAPPQPAGKIPNQAGAELSNTQPAPEMPEIEEALSQIDPVLDLEEVQRMVRGFRDVLGENPIGTNSEITRALTGGNLRQVKMPVPRGSSVSEGGELVDRWGTPYFFHQLSAEEMQVRSAGPDREMWTADDHQVN